MEQKKDPLDGKIGYLLIATIAVQFLFPISVTDNQFVELVYALFYISMFVVGIYFVSSSRLQMQTLILATIIWIICTILFAIDDQQPWLLYVIYFTLIYFLGNMVLELFKYIFRSKVVTRDVLLASCTVYLLLGGIFATVFNIIEVTTWFNTGQHAFTDSLNAYENEVIPWQVMVYYSYATLSTLGYGDVLPVTAWSRSAATLEAVVGVLYTAVIVARLVGLYAAGEIEDEIKNEDEMARL
ncbi:MAG: potassium channel family protein [Chloroflexota bacterium]